MQSWHSLAIVVNVISLLPESMGFLENMSKNYQMEWVYNERNIELKLTGATRGYMGIGFSETRTMEKADIIIAGIRDGVPYVWDCYSIGNGHLAIDAEQDVVVTAGFENDTHTSVTVTKSLISNRSDDYNFNAGEVNVIWAFGEEDKERQLQQSDYHQENRGFRRFEILRNASRETKGRITTTTRVHASTVTTSTKSDIISYSGLPYKSYLDTGRQIDLRWNFNNETITLQLTAPTLGWIGIGFSTKVSMLGADLIIMGKRSDGVYAIDCHAKRNGVPLVDEDQDVEILGGWENGTHTSIRIKRKVMPCSKDDMNINLDQTLRILWAYGEEDIEGGSPKDSNYHGINRGGRSLMLTNDQKFITDEGIQSTGRYWDVGVTNLTVPAKSTYYRCVILKVPTDSSLYAKAYEPVITRGNEQNVHHILLYKCARPREWFRHGYSAECYADLDPYAVGCWEIFAGWAIGSVGAAYPEKTALSIPTYMIVEIHYDNPARREFLDNSGLRLHYTERTPEVLMGTLRIEESISHILVPPRAEDFIVAGYCQPECINKGMENANVSEVTVFASLLHSHTAGRSIRLRHFRDGKELKPLTQDNNYDFDYQETRYLSPGTKIKAGDSFRIECVYDTRNRVNVTTGGLPTSSEMCMAFLTYYPAVDLNACYSRPKIEDPWRSAQIALQLGLNLTKLNSMSDELLYARFAMERLSPLFNEVNWTYEKVQAWISFIKDGPRYSLCQSQNGLILGFYNEFMAPQFKNFTQDDDEKCALTKEAQKTQNDNKGNALVRMEAAAAAIVLLLMAGATWKLRA